MWRDSGSSVSSQCMSTISPRSAAISQSSVTERRPSSMVRSKCGMPPTMSTPRSSARMVFCRAARRAIEAVLREGDELQVDIGRDLLLHVEQRLDRQQPVVAGVDMAADGEQAHRHRPVAIGERAVAHGLMRQQRLQLAPQPDAFEQRARGIDARNAVGQRRIHVEMRIDEGRRDEVAGWRRRRVPASAAIAGSIAAIRSPEMPMSATLPSGRMPPLTMMSKLMSGLSVSRRRPSRQPVRCVRPFPPR